MPLSIPLSLISSGFLSTDEESCITDSTSTMNRDVEMDQTSAVADEPMIVCNSESQEDKIRWINCSVLAKAKLLKEMKEKSQQAEQELREKSDKSRSLREQNTFNESEVAGLQFREQEALANLRQKQESLDESRREVERLQRLLKEEKKIQTEKLTKYEDDMKTLSQKFVNAPIVNDAQALEVELKVLQAMSDEVRGELVAVRRELQEVTDRYGLMTEASMAESATIADEHNSGVFIKRVIEEMQAEVSREKKCCGNLTQHMRSLELTASNMRRELDNIKSKK